MKIPAIVGAVKINSIQSSSIFQVGDIFWNAPESEGFIIAGAGSYNIGDGLRTIVTQAGKR